MKKSHKQSTEAAIESSAAEVVAKQGASNADAPATTKKEKAARKAKAAAKGAGTARSKSNPDNGQLVCRYCGSDDLAPSFIKRRDARCRTCFKQRYGSDAKGKRSAAA